MRLSKLSPLLLGAVLALTACSEKKADDAAAGDGKKPAEAPAEEPAGEPAAKPDEGQDVAAAADPDAKSHPECVGPMADEPVETIDLGGKKLQRAGSVLTLEGADDDDQFMIGQVTDVKDFTPENEANLKIAVKWFKEEKVDAIAVTGDLGESVESIEKVLDTFAEVGVPVLAIAGNRECRDHFTQALGNVSKRHKHVINMNQVRVFNADDASVVSLPGYYNRSYIHCAEGCEYTPGDVKALAEIATKATAPAKVLISHGPPKMDGGTGLDRIHEEVNVGDPELAKFLAGGTFPFGLFGNIQEAGGYGTDLSGTKRVPQDVFADNLYVNPGPIDAVRWAMLDGSESLGMAGILTIKGKQAKYKIYRIRPGEAKPAK